MYQPGPPQAVPPMVSPWTRGWGVKRDSVSTSNPGSGSYEAANRGIWSPVLVPVQCTIRRFWWANGSSVSASYNIEAGIYTDDGHKPKTKIITTGSTAQGTATEVQFVDVTDTVLTPGMYWLYLSVSTTSATVFRVSVGGFIHQELVGFQQSSVGPGSAPATATPVQATGGYLYVFGFATTASP